MAVLVVVVPAAVGGAAVRMLPDEDRPTGVGPTVRGVLRGYPYTVGLAVTLVMLLVLAPLLKARNVLRRWTDRHVPIVVEPRHYAGVVRDLHDAPNRGGVPTRAVPATWMIRAPTRVLTFFAGGSVTHLVAEQLTTLTSHTVEVMLHPSDLVISGTERNVARAQAILAANVTFTHAYLTWDKEANALEDRLRRVWSHVQRASLADEAAERAWGGVMAVERDLRELTLPYEEWEVVYREISMVKVELLRRQPLLGSDTVQAVTAVAAAVGPAAEAVPALFRPRRFNGDGRTPLRWPRREERGDTW